MTPTDDQLIRAARRGDADAFCRLYDRHADALADWLTGVSGERELSLDVTQETFARALVRIDGLRVTPEGSALPWLRRTSRNLLVDAVRRGRVERGARVRLHLLEPGAADAGWADEAGDRIDAARRAPELERALSRLPHDQRVALRRRVVDGSSYGEIARTSGESEQTIRARVSRGLRSLHTIVSRG